MKNRKKLCLALLFPVLLGCESEPQPGFEQCDEWNELTVEMESSLQKIKKKYANDDLFISRLNESQVYWLQYKERHMKMLYPEGYDVTRRKYGRDLFNPCKCAELNRLFSVRVDELNSFYEGPRSGQELCPTSNNHKILKK